MDLSRASSDALAKKHLDTDGIHSMLNSVK